MPGDRYNEGKLQWSLVPFSGLEQMVRVLEYGKAKYSADNWKRGLTTIEICESSLRHTFAFLSGEDIDPESGLPHYAHMQCNTLFLAWMMENKPEFDNRGTGN